jgi:hypothetical protein
VRRLEVEVEPHAVHAELLEYAEDGVVRFQDLSLLPAQHAQHMRTNALAGKAHQAQQGECMDQQAHSKLI